MQRHGSGAATAHMDVTSDAWPVHPIAADVRLRIVREMPPLPPVLEAEVTRLWDSAQARMSGRLFNGRVFSADAITPALIRGHWTEFRRIVARMDSAEVGRELGVRPVAAGGLIVGGTTDRFVVFGRRPEGAVYQPGEWQLPPAGSIDTSALQPDGSVDPLRQLRGELAEELGLPGDAVGEARALCLVEHPASGVLDLGIAVRTHWTPAAIRAAHAARGNGEYSALEFVPLGALPAFLARHAGQVTRQAPVFLAHAGLLPPTG
jgi:hypothetical protein